MMTEIPQIQHDPASEKLVQANDAWFHTVAKTGPDTGFSKTDLTPGPVQTVRARADQRAFRSRYHDPACQEALRPKDRGAGLVLAALERGRADALGSRTFPGAGRNMAEHVSWAFHSLPLFQQLEAFAFARLTREGQYPFSSQSIAQLQKHFHALDALWEPLAGLATDQEAFGREVLAFLETSTEAAILAQRLTAERDNAEPETLPGMADAQLHQENLPEPDSEGEPIQSRTAEENRPDVTAPEGRGGYCAYTTAFDCIIPADRLFTPEERRFYARQLDRESLPYRPAVTRLARRLMRRIMAWQRRSWVFDQDEGVLDPRRLAGLAADPMNHRIFMQESRSPFPATVVSLAIDNSGSMKGRPIQMAAMTVKILGEALERCGVKTEILGYTTRTWNGGRARKQWHQAGSPPHPGRLNESLHIIYKAADTPWRRARHNLGVMLHPELLKENIDGEALGWAWHRLLNRPEPRRILVILCDGSPHDEATLQTNPPDYLTRHLRDVIGRIERSPIQLAAIGIRHPVGRFYSQAVFLEKMDNLAESLTRQLLRLFDPDSASGKSQ